MVAAVPTCVGGAFAPGIARRMIQFSTKLGPAPLDDRTHQRMLGGFRWLCIRYERCSQFYAVAEMACSVICFNGLQQPPAVSLSAVVPEPVDRPLRRLSIALSAESSITEGQAALLEGVAEHLNRLRPWFASAAAGWSRSPPAGSSCGRRGWPTATDSSSPTTRPMFSGSAPTARGAPERQRPAPFRRGPRSP